MIELQRHIEILLLSNDCVIVPGFGGFTAHHVSARYDEADNVFLPPLRTLGFNPSLSFNDSLLAQSYVEAYDISYPEAVMRIEKEVEELRQHLDDKGAYEMYGIGTISQRESSHYEFEPCEAGILTPSLYGLNIIDIKPLAHATRRVSNAENAETVSENTETTAEIRSLMPTEQETKTVSIPVSWLRNAAAIIIGILTFFMLPEQIGSQQVEMASGINTGLLYHIMPKDITTPSQTAVTEEKTADENSAEKATGTPVAVPENVASATEEATEKPYFCIVLASQVSQKNAQAFIERLQKAGYTEARTMERRTGLKVVYGKYSTEQEAANVKRRLCQHDETADCWVMEVRPGK